MTSDDIFMLLMEGETATAAGLGGVDGCSAFSCWCYWRDPPPTRREGFLPINTSLTDSGLNRVALTNPSSGLARVSTVCAQGLAWTLRDRYVTSLKSGLSQLQYCFRCPPRSKFRRRHNLFLGRFVKHQ